MRKIKVVVDKVNEEEATDELLQQFEAMQKNTRERKKTVAKDYEKLASAIHEKYEILSLPCNNLENAPDTWNFFSAPSNDKLIELAASIRYNGLLQPIVVRKLDGIDRYQILAGHSRRKAFELLYKVYKEEKYKTIQAIVFDTGVIDDNRAKEIICDTNYYQRGNLPPQELAKCISMKASILRTTGSRNIRGKIAEAYDMKLTTVSQWIRIANLIDELVILARDKGLNIKAQYNIAGYSKEDQKRIFDEAGEYIDNISAIHLVPEQGADIAINYLKNTVHAKKKIIRFKDVAENSYRSKDIAHLVYVDPKHLDEFNALIEQFGKAYIVAAHKKGR